jgi:phosphonoacetate hydrolase
VEGVLDRAAAARAFELPLDRIGDLVVLSDAETALGGEEARHDLSALRGPLRSHGGLHEQDVPLVLCQPVAADRAERDGLRNADLFDLLLNGAAPAADPTLAAPAPE